MSYTRVSTDQPRHPPSEVINRIELSDPQEDVTREQARIAESTGRSDTQPGLHLVNDGGTDNPRSPKNNAPRRQDFSNEKVSKRDTRLGDYFLGQTLGEGEFGKVKMGWKQAGGVQVAIKLIRREKLDTPARLTKVYREINILRELDHPNIVRLHEMVETERTIGIILEYASGGELFDYILHERYLKDTSARRLFAQLVSGIGYLHKKGIIHRDLKLENLLLDRNQNIIITDFGFANTFNPVDELGEHIEKNLHRRSFVKKHKLEAVNPETGFRRGDLMATSCGSPCYAAPELVISTEGIYTGRKVDVWSCGVILYAMLAGYLPFDDDPANPDGDNINLLYRYISSAPLVFPEHVTPHARDLLRRILVPDPRKRADLFEVARHTWLLEYAHVVESITSGTTTTPADISRAAIGTDGAPSGMSLTRSASVKEASKAHQTVSPVGGLVSKQGKVTRTPEQDLSKSSTKDSKRRTVQVEYLPPQSQTTRGDAPDLTYQTDPQHPNVSGSATNPTRQTAVNGKRTQFSTTQEAQPPPPPPKNNMPPPTRPMRDAPRSTSDSNALTMNQSQQATRPSTQGSLSNSRLPSRSSYGQPAAATVATTNAQGRFSQPKPASSSGYVISAPVPQPEPVIGDPSRRPDDIRRPPHASTAETSQRQRGHNRSQTLSDLGQKIFGRSPSTRQKPETRPKPDRSYPPTSMRPIDTEAQPRRSNESRRSFGFVRRSVDNPSTPKRSSRRFSLFSRSGGTSKGDQTPQAYDSPTASSSGYRVPPMDGSGDLRQPPQSYAAQDRPSENNHEQAQMSQYNHNNEIPRTYANNASRGNPAVAQTYPQQWPLQQNQPSTVYPARRPPTTTEPLPAENEKPSFKSEQWNSNRRFQTSKSGPAQRVMDFFRGRRHDRSGLA